MIGRHKTEMKMKNTGNQQDRRELKDPTFFAFPVFVDGQSHSEGKIRCTEIQPFVPGFFVLTNN